MLRSYTFWLKIASVVQVLTALIHSISLFVEPQATNDKESQMLELMKIKTDMGAGFSPSQWDLFLALSSCFTLAYLLGGVTNIHLMRNKVDVNVMRGIIQLNLMVFTSAFITMFFLTFIYPVVLTGLVVVFLLAAWLTLPKAIAKQAGLG
jgi:hypothetical protein